MSSKLKQALKSSATEVDQRQIDIYHRLSPADRFRQGCSINRIALERMYRDGLDKMSLKEINALIKRCVPKAKVDTYRCARHGYK